MKKKTVIGIDLGGTNVRAGVIKDGKLVKVIAKPIRSSGSKEEVLEDLFAVIDDLKISKIGGIGVGVPSLVDAKTGIIRDTTNIPSWKEVPLRKILERRFKAPIYIDNDANCFALGERAFGHGKACANFVGLILGTGLGAGIVSNGKLHSGVDCGAGEFGTIPYLDGIVEHYASGQYFRQQAREGSELAAAADRGDVEALKLYAEYGRHLGFAFKVILYSLAPEMIILGGSVSGSYRHFEKALRESLGDFAYPSVLKRLKVKVSSRQHIAILGAGTLVHDKA
jgi:glucokinase